jgi:hypothetical protein
MSGRRSSRRVHDAVELGIGVGQAGEVAVVDDGGGETRLGKDHHAGGRLDQVRAGARAHHQEEGVLDLAVQPDDAGQAAEHLALAAFAQHRDVAQPGAGRMSMTAFMPGPLRWRLAPPAQPRGAQLQQELRGVDQVGGVGRQASSICPRASSAPVYSATR